MKKEGSRSEVTEIKLIDLMKVFIRRKWWFIGAFIIIFITGILFAFLRTPQFNMTSTLIISSIKPDYYESIMQSFPEKTRELTGVSNISESNKFLSEDLLEEVIGNLEFDIDINKLKDTIFIYTVKGEILQLTTVYNDAEETYEINKIILETYLNNRIHEINQAYQDLLNEIELEMSTITAEIEDLSEKSDDEDSLVNKETELKYETYYRLEENKDFLIENKDYFTDRIKVSEAPDISNVYRYFNYKRDIILSFFLAIAVGLMTTFAVNYFQSLKK